MTTRLIVGCGYVGSRLAQRWNQDGDTVYAMTRSLPRARALEELGILPIIWDWYSSNPPCQSQHWTSFQQESRDPYGTVLIAVSHASVPEIPSAETHLRGLINLKKTLPNIGDTKWIYLSTTSVFGEGQGGDWLNELSPVAPSRPGSIAACEAESWFNRLCPEINSVIIRSAGIYGPGRLPNWQAVRDKVPLFMAPDSYLNLVHVDDLVRILDQISNRKMQHRLYCVSDCEPVLRKDYYALISQLKGWAGPIFSETIAGYNEELNAHSRRSRGVSNKRIQSERIRFELAYQYLYPTYREGLTSLMTYLDDNAFLE